MTPDVNLSFEAVLGYNTSHDGAGGEVAIKSVGFVL